VHYERSGTQLASGLSAGFALLLLASPPPLWSAVYQCKGPDGSTVFSDSPCGADAKEIIVRPQPPLSNTTPAARRSATGTTNRGKSSTSSTAQDAARSTEALKCQAREFGAWYQAQNPKPTREVSDLKMSQIVDACWLATNLVSAQENVTVNPVIKTVIHKAPQPVGGSAGAASAPAGAGGPLQVSRSRQPQEAARWSSYYSCRSKTYEDWSNALGHAPDDAEAQQAQARSDSQCRAQFNIPAGAAAIITD
jgi:uncharacterized protein DUF4124